MMRVAADRTSLGTGDGAPAAGMRAAVPASAAPASAGPAADEVGARPWRGIASAYVLGFVLAAGAILLGYAAGLQAMAASQARRDLHAQLASRTAGLVLAVDQQLRAAVRFADALASSPALAAGDWTGFLASAPSVLATAPDLLAIDVSDPVTGGDLARLARGGAAPAPLADLDRKQIAETARLGRPMVFGVRVDGVPGDRPVVPVRVPVRRDGAGAPVLTVALDAAAFNRLLSESVLPDSWIGLVVDPTRRIAGRSREALSYAGRPVAPQLHERLASGSADITELADVDGAPSLAAWTRSPATDWTVVIGIPSEEAHPPVKRRVVLAGTFGALAIAFGSGLAILIGRQTRRAAAAERTLSQDLAILVQRRSAELRAADAKARDATRRLEDAIRLFPSAIVLYDAEQRLVLCNDRFKEIYRPFRDRIVPGVTMRELGELVWDHGMIQGYPDRETFLSQRQKMIDRGGEVREATGDGRRLLIQDFRTPDGGILGIRIDVTALRQMQLALERSEARFRDFAEASSDGFWEADAALRLTYVSRRLAGADGSDSGAMLGRTWQDIAGDRGATPSWRQLFDDLAARRGFRDLVVPLRFEGEDGERQVSVNARPLVDAGGGFVGYRGTISDVTERQRAVERLQRSEEQLRLVTDNVPAVISYIDREERFRFLSRSFAEWYGRPIESALGERIGDVMLPESYARIAPHIALALAGQICNIEAAIDYPGGRRRDLQVAFVPHAVDGEVAGLFTVAVDISGIKSVERALRRSERQLRTIFESEPQCVSLVDRDGMVIDINPAGLVLLEAGKGDAVAGSSMFQWLAPEFHDPYRAQLARVFHGETVTQELEIVCLTGGRRRLEAVTAPLRASDGEVIAALSIAADITDRRAMEERLRQSQRLEAIGQLTGGVAHDFNNLLSVVTLNLDLLAMDLGDRKELRQLCERAVAAAERGAGLTRQLLAFARRQHLTPQAIDANEMIEETADTWRQVLGDGIRLIAGPLDARWPCRVDRAQLESAMLNLVMNARDAMTPVAAPGGGSLCLRTRDIAIDAESARQFDGLEPGDYVRIEVEDNGTGMSREVRSRAFEPFFTTKDLGKGSGLGLSMVYGFVKQSGGQAVLSSEPGQGTKVQLYLPAQNSLPDGAIEPPDDEAQPQPRGAKVLVVDDVQEVREATVALLGALGYRVTGVAGAAVALDALERDPDTALMFTDIGLGGTMNGVELAAGAQVVHPGLKVLFTSGNPNWRATEAGKRLPEGAPFLPKPYRTTQLCDCLAKLDLGGQA